MNCRRKILIYTMTILVLVVLAAVARHFQLRWSLESDISKLKAEGEPLSLAQVIPPPVARAENGAPLITNALEKIYSQANDPRYLTNSVIFNNAPEQMNQTMPGGEMIGWHEPAIHSRVTWPRDLTNTWDELALELAANRNDLRDLKKLIGRPTLDFSQDYSDVIETGVGVHAEQLKLAVEWLEASEYYELHRGRTADACTDVRTMLALVRGAADERYEISQLIRQALARMSADATWDILQTTDVTDADLAQLQTEWQSLQFIAPMEKSFLFERVNDLRLEDSARDSSTNLSWWLGSLLWKHGYSYEKSGKGNSAQVVLVDKSPPLRKFVNRIVIPWDEAQWRWFWSYEDEIRALAAEGIVLDGIQAMETNRSSVAAQTFISTNFARLNLNSAKLQFFEVATRLALSQDAAIRRTARAQVARNMVITAIAIKRYEMRHNRAPDFLAQLVPDFLDSVPIDFMDGKPLRYRKTGDETFLLYSVGENGKDDGGNPEWTNTDLISDYYDWQSPHALDWVWPQRATQEEIRAFFASQKLVGK